MHVCKMNEDKFLYTVSEESILKSWDNDTFEDHEFSQSYYQFREKLIQKAGSGKDERENDKKMSVYELKPEKKWYRHPVGVAAAIAAAIILSAGAYALSGLFRIKSQEHTGDIGTYTYELEAVGGEDGATVQPVRLVPNYIPEGYEYLQEHFKDSEEVKKYKNTGGSGRLTIGLMNHYTSESFNYISSEEHVEENGVKTDILTQNADTGDSYIIIMFYEELGQIVTVFGRDGISLEETKKVVENLVLKPTGEEPYQAFSEERTTYEEKSVIVKDGRQVQIGEAMTYEDSIDSENLSFTVTDIELRDNISGLEQKYFVNYEGILSLLDANGNFAVYEQKESVWENNALIEKSLGERHLGFAYITAEIKNLSEGETEDNFVWGRLIYEDPETGEEEKEFLSGVSSECIYYDGSDYADVENGKHIFASDFETGETRTVHLGVIFLKERQDEAYLKFFDWTNVTDDCYVKLIP